MGRCWARATGAVLVAVAVAAAAAVPVGAAAADCLRPPVTAPIADHFRDPPCPWCAGNRGLQYDVDAGTPVLAAAAGTVTFAGVVAGVRYVVVVHADGLRATYGGLASSPWRAGDRLPAGAVVGRAGAAGLHFGLRRGDVYLDPEPRMGELRARPRLVPTDGTPARPAPPPALRCPSAIRPGGPIA